MIVLFEDGWQLGNEIWISNSPDKPLLFCRTTGKKYGPCDLVVIEPGGQAEPAARAVLRMAKLTGLTKPEQQLVAQFASRAATSTRGRLTQRGRRVRGLGRPSQRLRGNMNEAIQNLFDKLEAAKFSGELHLRLESRQIPSAKLEHFLPFSEFGRNLPTIETEEASSLKPS